MIATNRLDAARRRLAPIGLAGGMATSLLLAGCGSGADDSAVTGLPGGESRAEPTASATQEFDKATGSGPRTAANSPWEVAGSEHSPAPAPFRLDGEVDTAGFETLTPPPLPEIPMLPDPAELAPGLKADVEQAAGEVVGGARQAFDGIAAEATGAASGLRANVDQTVGEVRSGVRETLDEVKGGALDIAGEVRGEVESAIGEARGGVEATIGEVQGGVRQATDVVKGQVDEVIEGAKQEVRQAAGQVKGRVASEAQKAKDELKRSARELTGQFFEGLLGPGDVPPPRPEPAPAPAPAPAPSPAPPQG
ncbi:hypothetical protein [Tautonia sociabilis]|uniref:Uncharacterized protein n=1 Tax=Tautonia sociabilis TaxID=2080755 RepID=A0A432MMW9_9BACT|nr:hypothetical protein [Tautonia sociabilis]RUL88794.1 hypothetical protein TsocGM_05405 [Tautonia sociabilis]